MSDSSIYQPGYLFTTDGDFGPITFKVLYRGIRGRNTRKANVVFRDKNGSVAVIDRVGLDESAPYIPDAADSIGRHGDVQYIGR